MKPPGRRLHRADDTLHDHHHQGFVAFFCSSSQVQMRVIEEPETGQGRHEGRGIDEQRPQYVPRHGFSADPSTVKTLDEGAVQRLLAVEVPAVEMPPTEHST